MPPKSIRKKSASPEGEATISERFLYAFILRPAGQGEDDVVLAVYREVIHQRAPEFLAELCQHRSVDFILL